MRVRLLLGIAIILALSGCAGPNELIGTYGRSGVAGFWSGLWHGMICPIAFVISLFNSDVTIYEVHNSGGWYSGGFILGAGAWGLLRGSGGSSKSVAVVATLEDYDDEEILEEAENRGLLSDAVDDEFDDEELAFDEPDNDPKS